MGAAPASPPPTPARAGFSNLNTHTHVHTYRHTETRRETYTRTHITHTHTQSAPRILPWALGSILPWPDFCRFARLPCPGAQPPSRTLPVLLPEWFPLQAAPAAPGWAVLPRLQNAHSTRFSTRLPWPGTRLDTRDGPGGWKSEIRVPVGPCLLRLLSGVCGLHLLRVLTCPHMSTDLCPAGQAWSFRHGVGVGGCPGARGWCPWGGREVWAGARLPGSRRRAGGKAERSGWREPGA